MDEALLMLGPTQEVPRTPFHSFAAEPARAEVEPPVSSIRDYEIDSIYANLEEDAMMSIFADLEGELRDVYAAPAVAPQPAQESLLWHVVATPTMMRDYGAQVAAASLVSTLPLPPLVPVAS